MHQTADRQDASLLAWASAAGSGELHVLQIDPVSGCAQTLQCLALGGAIMPLAISPDGRWLHAVDRREPFQVHTLAIDPRSGRLSPHTRTRLAGNVVQLAVSRDGRWLMTASYDGDFVAMHPIDPDGRVGEASQVLPTLKHAHAICPSPDGRTAWVSCLGADRLLAHRMGPAGLEPRPVIEHPCPTGSGPRHLAFHPHRNWLFVIHELAGTVACLEVDGERPPRLLGQASVLPAGATCAPWSAELRISPDGRWLFATDRREGTLSAIRICLDSGRLTHAAHMPTEPLPRSFAVSADGRTLLVASQDSGHLSVIRFDPDTADLRPLGRHPCGLSPTWVEIRPTGAW